MTRPRIPAVVLGATGTVGQRIVQLLAKHPWFELGAVAASEGSAGRPYAEVCHWTLPGAPPEAVATRIVDRLDPSAIDCGGPAIAFSALPAGVARKVEPRFAEAGYVVCSNASAFRDEPDVPLVIPEVNPDQPELLDDRDRPRHCRARPGFRALAGLGHDAAGGFGRRLSRRPVARRARERDPVDPGRRGEDRA